MKRALTEVDVAATMHLYAEGGHGYGLRPSEHLVGSWPDRAETWLRRQLGEALP